MLKKWIPLWVVPVLISFSMGTVWLRLAMIRTTYAINQLDRETENALHEREITELKVAALRSPKRLEELARIKFKLVQPQMGQVVRLKNVEPKSPEMSENDF